MEQNRIIRRWLSIVVSAVLGGAFLATIISIVYALGSLAENLK